MAIIFHYLLSHWCLKYKTQSVSKTGTSIFHTMNRSLILHPCFRDCLCEVVYCGTKLSFNALLDSTCDLLDWRKKVLWTSPSRVDYAVQARHSKIMSLHNWGKQITTEELYMSSILDSSGMRRAEWPTLWWCLDTQSLQILSLHMPQNCRQFCFVRSDATEEIQEMEEQFVDDGSLPLDENGALPFYFLDAHEEHSSPDLVYLFGKVAHT